MRFYITADKVYFSLMDSEIFSNLFSGFFTVCFLSRGKAKASNIKTKENIMPPRKLSNIFNLKLSKTYSLLKIIFLIIPYFSLNLHAKEPTLCMLNSINSNDIQEFSISTYHFTCKPYGILTLEELYKSADLKSKCKSAIKEFYSKNPELLFFSQRHLKTCQLYHIDFRDGRCIVYTNGQTTLSQMLLENGLAVRKPNLKNDEFRYIFLKAQDSAKFNKKGMWQKNIIRKCVVEIYK